MLVKAQGARCKYQDPFCSLCWNALAWPVQAFSKPKTGLPLSLFDGACRLKPLVYACMQVSIAAQEVCLTNLVIKGAETQQFVVDVGQGSSVKMEGCQVEGGNADGGAVGVRGDEKSPWDSSSFAARNSSMRSASGRGLWVREGGSVGLEGCTSKGCGKDGWVVGEGSRLVVWKSSTQGNMGNGLLVHGKGSNATASACSFSRNKASNVVVQLGAEATLRERCMCENSNFGSGLNVIGKGSNARASNCLFSGNMKTNVAVQDGAAALLQEGCECDDSQQGNGLLVIGKGSTAIASDCSFINNKMTNVVVKDGAAVRLQEGCKCDRSEDHGLGVTGKGSTATASACSFSRNKKANVCAQKGAAAVLQEGCKCDGSKEGNGLVVIDKGSTATASACSISRNMLTNVIVEGGATAVLQEGCKCESSKAGSGVKSGSGSMLSVRDCSLTGNKHRPTHIQWTQTMEAQLVKAIGHMS